MRGNAAEYYNIISFIKEIERLKNITRTAWTSEKRQESVAEHSWRLAMYAFVLGDYFPDYDMAKAVQLSLIHDMGEAFEGDISAKLEVDQKQKLKTEEYAMNTITATLPEPIRTRIMELWWEYNLGETKEAKLVKAIDKMETIIQHNQGDNPANFDYEFNLAYGKKYAEFDPIIQAIRSLIDGDTSLKIRRTHFG
ncbi:HD domain-containing protein [Paenibacillus sp. y28]|uniref:HD domain-containing protein n=1 Tax=Paenibacillus sp. y28 TaxID=3129110 RepID=UPI00301804AF